MSTIRIATAIFISAGLSLSAVAGTQVGPPEKAQLADTSNSAPDTLACEFEQAFTFRRPASPRHIGTLAHPLDILPCSGAS